MFGVTFLGVVLYHAMGWWAEGWFNLMLIAHTQKCIVLPTRPVGALVNLEVDVIGKYAQAATQQLREELEDFRGQLQSMSAELAQLRARL